MKRLVALLAAMTLLALVGWSIVIHCGAELHQQDAVISELEKRNGKLAKDAARWEDVAVRFEQLNRECLALKEAEVAP